MEVIKKAFESFGVPITEKQCKQFKMYYDLLVEWNQKMNLTTITDYEEVITKHFLDSAAILQFEYVDELAGKCIDIGTGAGFPGIPLKILCPNLEITLLDSLNKRIGFLNEVIRKLELKNITAVHGRAEDIGQDKRYREKYDICVSRAVANLSTLSEYCLPFVKVGGVFISYKSIKINEEIEKYGNSVGEFGGAISRFEEFDLPNTDMVRSLLFIDKEENTQRKYPRKAGKPEKDPII